MAISSTWDRFYLVKRIPVWMYWGIFGLLTFLVAELIIRAFGDERLVGMRVSFASRPR